MIVINCSADGGQKPMVLSEDKTIRRFNPLSFSSLGLLQYLSREWTFDNIEEATKVTWDVHRFSHAFTTFGAKFLYPRFV
jgi:hypothetical protein